MFVALFNSTSNVTPLQDLSGKWQACLESSNNSKCNAFEVTFPGQLPLNIEKQFKGQVVLSRSFTSPKACISGEVACSLLINEMGDSGKIYLNGLLLGVRGFQKDKPTYEKHYPVQIDLPQAALQAENTLRIELYSNKFMQTGLTKPPLGIVETSAARNFLKSKVFYNVFLPLVSAAILVALLMAFVSFPLGELRNSKSYSLVLFYGISSILFLISFSEIPREYLSMQIASPLHFLFRYTSDFGLFLLLRNHLKSANFIKSKFFITYYVLAILPFLVLIFAGLANELTFYSFDTSFFTYSLTRYSWPMKLLPFIPLYFILKHLNEKSASIRFVNSLLLISCLIFVFQINDILLFFGLVKSIYFIKFYPVIVCFVAIGYLVFSARELDEEDRIRRSRQEAIFKTTQMLAHDVKTPFTKLHAVLELFKLSSSDEETKQVISERVPGIEQSLLKVESLISDILSYSFSTKLAFVSVEPKTLIERVVQQLQSTVDCSSVEVQTSFVSNTPLECDQSKLARVLFNISKNAVEAMNGNGKLKYEVNQIQEANERLLKISISNTGPSIPKADLQKIFDSFYTNRKDGGTGLGLSIAKSFVDAHNGKIWCETLRGKGVQFIILLPLKQRLPTEKQFDTQEHHDNSPILGQSENTETRASVLIVEDDPIFQENISKIFEEYQKHSQSQFEINIADNYESGVSQFTSKPPDLLIVDLDLGANSKNGLQLINETRKIRNSTFICVHSSQIDHYKINEQSADFVLPKPMNLEKLSSLLSNFSKRKETVSHALPIVIVVDDEVDYLKSWTTIMTDADVRCYSDHEHFWDEVVENPSLLLNTDAIILDYFFPGTNVDKLKLVRALRNKGFKGPILLSSNVAYNNEHTNPKDRFDFVIGKTATKYSDLLKTNPRLET